MAERGLNTADAALLQLFTRRTGALLRWQKKRGILRSVKDSTAWPVRSLGDRGLKNAATNDRVDTQQLQGSHRIYSMGLSLVLSIDRIVRQ